MKIEQVLENYFNIKNLQYKDTSKGCDNNVFKVEVDGIKYTIKMPKKEKEKRPNAHSTLHLQWFAKQCLNFKVKVPKTFYYQEEFIIEECIGECDVSDIIKNDKKSVINIYKDIGKDLKKLHSIKTQKFCGMSEIPGIGKLNNWYDEFSINFNTFKNECIKKRIIKEDDIIKIENYFKKMEKYLKEFNDPRLLHCDVSINNVRIEMKEKEYIYSGLIDFSDAMSGDPLFDIGEIFQDIYFDDEIFKSLEEGYGKFSKEEIEIILFYSLYYSLFLKHQTSILKCLDVKFFYNFHKL